MNQRQNHLPYKASKVGIAYAFPLGLASYFLVGKRRDLRAMKLHFPDFSNAPTITFRRLPLCLRPKSPNITQSSQ